MAVDPLQWERQNIDDDVYDTYGSCQSSGTVGETCEALMGLLNFVALVAVVW